MKKHLSLCIAFFCSFGIMAQDQVSWSVPLTELSYRVRDIIFFKDHGYVLKVNGDGFAYSKKNKSTLQQLDNRLNYTKEVDIKLMYEGEKAEPKQLIALNDKLYPLYLGYAEKEKRLLLSEIDPDNLNFPGDPIVLGTVKSTRSQIWMEQSENGRFFSVFAYWGDDGASKAYVTCYDNNFQNLYEEEKGIDLRYVYNGFSQLVVDDEGNTFALMEEQITLGYADPPVFWQRYKSGESIVSRVKDDKNKHFIRKARIIVSDEVVLLAGYFTAQDFNDDRVKGITFLAYDKATKGNAKQAEVAVPRNLSKYIAKTTHKRYKESEEEIPMLNLVDIKDWEGHGYLIVGERPYLYSASIGFHLANPVAFVSLVDYSLTKVEWTIPICKYMVPGLPSQGVFLALEKDKANVFFNAYDELNKQYEEAPLYGNGFIHMTINPEGAHATRVLCARIDKLDIVPNLIKPIDGKSFFVLASRVYKDRLGIIRP